jgi:hypothetical protein
VRCAAAPAAAAATSACAPVVTLQGAARLSLPAHYCLPLLTRHYALPVLPPFPLLPAHHTGTALGPCAHLPTHPPTHPVSLASACCSAPGLLLPGWPRPPAGPQEPRGLGARAPGKH